MAELIKRNSKKRNAELLNAALNPSKPSPWLRPLPDGPAQPGPTVSRTSIRQPRLETHTDLQRLSLKPQREHPVKMEMDAKPHAAAAAAAAEQEEEAAFDDDDDAQLIEPPIRKPRKQRTDDGPFLCTCPSEEKHEDLWRCFMFLDSYAGTISDEEKPKVHPNVVRTLVEMSETDKRKPVKAWANAMRDLLQIGKDRMRISWDDYCDGVDRKKMQSYVYAQYEKSLYTQSHH
jgi:hypothetical protein